MKLLCKKYQWNESTAKADVNFFSSFSPVFVSEIDLYDYLIKDSLGSVNYQFTNISENNTLLYNSSYISFQCINSIYNGTDLIDYFSIYNANDYIKYKFELYNDENEIIFTSVIYNDGISIENKETEILSIVSVGYEREFSEYFKDKIITAVSLIPPSINRFQYLKLYNLQTVLYKNFPNIPFNFFGNPLTDLTARWYIANRPYTFSPDSSAYEDNIFECKAGYESFYNDKLNKFDLLNGICLALGWTWYFYLGKLYIEANAQENLNVYDIDYNETFIEHSIINTSNSLEIENVILNGGTYYANYNANALRPLSIFTTASSQAFTFAGDRRYLFNFKNENNLELRAYRSISLTADNHYLISYANHTQTRYKGDNDFNYSYEFNKYDTNNFSPFTLTDTEKNVFKTKSLVINVPVCSYDNGGQVDLNNARSNSGRYYGDGNSYGSSGSLIDSQFGYTGSIGESMIYFTTANKYMMYESYLRLPETANNFRVFMKSENKLILKLKIYDLITNPNQLISISNYPDADFSGKTFAISSLTFDLINNFTELILNEI